MVTTRQQALDIASEIKDGLEKIYGPRLRCVYLYGSAARNQLTEDSDIDIAVILDEIPNQYLEHKRTSQLGTDISLQNDTVVLFVFASEQDFKSGRFMIYKTIAEEGIPA